MEKSPAALRYTKEAIRAVRFMNEPQAADYLNAKSDALKLNDKEDSRSQGMKQFLDDKTYRPGLGALQTPEGEGGIVAASTTLTPSPRGARALARASQGGGPAGARNPFRLSPLALQQGGNVSRDGSNASRQQRLHLLLVDPLHQLIDQGAERHRHLGGLRQFERHVHVLLRPFTGALAPARERPIGAAALTQRLDQARDVGAELLAPK